MLLSPVIPVYNEEAVLPRSLESPRQVVKRIDLDHEIIFVNVLNETVIMKHKQVPGAIVLKDGKAREEHWTVAAR